MQKLKVRFLIFLTVVMILGLIIFITGISTKNDTIINIALFGIMFVYCISKLIILSESEKDKE